MTPQKQSRSSALFLTELILAILFFAAASAVCVQIFVKSHLLSLHSRQLNLAVNESSAIAELIEASDSMEEAVSLIQEKYPLAEIIENDMIIQIFYNKDLVPCTATDNDASLMLSVALSQENRELYTELATQTISSQLSTDVLYTLHISHHLQRRAPHES